MNLFQILDLCEGDILIVISAVKTIFTLIQWAIPLVLIVLGTIDMFKAMASGDEKATKESQKKFVRRLVYALVAFLIPFIVKLTFSLVSKNIAADEATTADNTVGEFLTCWNGKLKVCVNNSDDAKTTMVLESADCPKGYTKK